MIAPVFAELLAEPGPSRRTLSRWLEPEACRLAACYWWPTLPLPDLRSMIRLRAALIVQRPCARGLDARVIEQKALHALAHDVLDEAIRAMGLMHDESFGALHNVAISALRAGRPRAVVVQAAVSLARARTPLPPPWLVQDAIEKAARDYRFESRFQRQKAI